MLITPDKKFRVVLLDLGVGFDIKNNKSTEPWGLK